MGGPLVVCWESFPNVSEDHGPDLRTGIHDGRVHLKVDGHVKAFELLSASGY